MTAIIAALLASAAIAKAYAASQKPAEAKQKIRATRRK